MDRTNYKQQASRGKRFSVTLNRSNNSRWNRKETGTIMDFELDHIGSFTSLTDALKCIKNNKDRLNYVDYGTFYISFSNVEGTSEQTIYYDNGKKSGYIN